jgi:recombinational DNA repair protein (RecF pathway)
MNRHFEAEAIVLDHLVLGEDHRLVTFYLPERGLVKAMAHGSNKNKHRYKPLTQSFTGVEAKFYHDPVKDQYKVVDLKARYQPLGLGQSLDRIFWASVWAEVVLATRGGRRRGEDLPSLRFLLPRSG